MFSKTYLLGRIGHDPETTATTGGTTVAKFSLATSWYKDGEERTEWHRCVAFGKTADVVSRYVGKGDPLFVEGHNQTRSWEDEQSGQKRYMTEVVADRVKLLPRGSSGERQPSYDEDDDIPF